MVLAAVLEEHPRVGNLRVGKECLFSAQRCSFVLSAHVCVCRGVNVGGKLHFLQ